MLTLWGYFIKCIIYFVSSFKSLKNFDFFYFRLRMFQHIFITGYSTNLMDMYHQYNKYNFHHQFDGMCLRIDHVTKGHCLIGNLHRYELDSIFIFSFLALLIILTVENLLKKKRNKFYDSHISFYNMLIFVKFLFFFITCSLQPSIL